MNLKEFAQGYEPQQTHNVAELEKVPLQTPIQTRTGTDSNGVEFEYKIILVNDVEYRIANPVIEQIKTLLKAQPALEYVSVTRKGEGVKTRYTVDPLPIIQDNSVFESS